MMTSRPRARCSSCDCAAVGFFVSSPVAHNKLAEVRHIPSRPRESVFDVCGLDFTALLRILMETRYAEPGDSTNQLVVLDLSSS